MIETTTEEEAYGDYVVIVFDLCSSSSILESLERRGKLSVWKAFWSEIYSYLAGDGRCGESGMYKFMGDGFILILDRARWEDALPLCEGLVGFIGDRLARLLAEHVVDAVPRCGITMGIDCGSLYRFSIGESTEYTGIAINVAARLQALLSGKKDVNKVMLSRSMKNVLARRYRLRNFRPVVSVLRNIFRNRNVVCYEIDPTTVEEIEG